MSPPNRERNEDTPTPDSPKTLEQIGRTVSKIDRALCGDPYNREEEPGMLTMFLEMHDDYYGSRKRGIKGTKRMVEILWELRYKIMGGAAALGAAGSIIAWLIEQYIQAKH